MVPTTSCALSSDTCFKRQRGRDLLGDHAHENFGMSLTWLSTASRGDVIPLLKVSFHHTLWTATSWLCGTTLG